jgi:hypothetical protein
MKFLLALTSLAASGIFYASALPSQPVELAQRGVDVEATSNDIMDVADDQRNKRCIQAFVLCGHNKLPCCGTLVCRPLIATGPETCVPFNVHRDVDVEER